MKGPHLTKQHSIPLPYHLPMTLRGSSIKALSQGLLKGSLTGSPTIASQSAVLPPKSSLLHTETDVIRVNYFQLCVPQNVKHFERQGPSLIMPMSPVLSSTRAAVEQMLKGQFVVE